MIYEVIFAPLAYEQWEYWKRTNPKVAQRIKRILLDIREHPYTGIAKPERLKFGLAGKWSRRINEEHHIIYSVIEDRVEINVLSMRFHYSRKK